MTSIACVLVGSALAGALGWLGRRDLTHPAIAFGTVWFFFVAVAQLRLTELEEPWPAGVAALIVAGGLLFVAAALLTAGAAPIRGRVSLSPVDLSSRGLLVAAAVFIAGAFAGLAWKTSILGGVPLFSGEIDAVRGRAYGEGGASNVPAPSTFLTNGFHLGMWCVLAAAWIDWRRWRAAVRAAAATLVAVCLVGSLAGGSRNVAVFAAAIPLIVAYVATPRLPRRFLAASAIAAIALLSMSSFVFSLRLDESTDGNNFLARETERQPLLLRPVMPVYIAGAYPLETMRRVVDAFPERHAFGLGTYSLTSLPDAAFPRGKPDRAAVFGGLTYRGGGSAYWNVASYQGRAYADLGTAGVLLSSLLLGVLFGLVYRLARAAPSLVALTVVAYGAYYAAFLVYDNHLSFSVAAVYDLGVLAVVALLVARRRLA